MREREIIIVFKKNHEAAKKLSAVIGEWLTGQNILCRQIEANSGLLDVSANPRMVIALGGDGTILGLGRKLACKEIPIFGINFGRIGFLTVADPDNWRQMLEEALAGKAHIRDCTVLEWKHVRAGAILESGVAVNDVVLGHGALARLIGIETIIDGQKMGVLRCDGLITTTPLGSSAYNFSAGGPVMYAGMNAICLTPICPFQTGMAPLVFPASTEIELRIVPGTPECYLTLDGQDCVPIQEKDTVVAKGLPHALKLAGSRQQFFERLRSRGFQLDVEPDCPPL